MADRLISFNSPEQHPTLTASIESFEGGWPYEIDDLKEVSTRAKEAAKTVENCPWAVGKMITLYDEQLRLVEAARKTIETLRKTRLYKVENGQTVPDPEHEDRRSPSFDNGVGHLKKSTEKLLAFAFGIVFVSAMIAVAILFPEPTPFQYTVFRVVLSLAAAGVAAMIPGFIEAQVKPVASAGGALAVFLIVYAVAPAALPQAAPPSGYAKGREAGVAVSAVARAIDVYYAAHGQYPPSLSDVPVDDQIKKLGTKRLVYKIDTERGYVLQFAGEDGKLNTADDRFTDKDGLEPLR